MCVTVTAIKSYNSHAMCIVVLTLCNGYDLALYWWSERTPISRVNCVCICIEKCWGTEALLKQENREKDWKRWSADFLFCLSDDSGSLQPHALCLISTASSSPTPTPPYHHQCHYLEACCVWRLRRKGRTGGKERWRSRGVLWASREEERVWWHGLGAACLCKPGPHCYYDLFFNEQCCPPLCHTKAWLNLAFH